MTLRSSLRWSTPSILPLFLLLSFMTVETKTLSGTIQTFSNVFLFKLEAHYLNFQLLKVGQDFSHNTFFLFKTISRFPFKIILRQWLMLPADYFRRIIVSVKNYYASIIWMLNRMRLHKKVHFHTLILLWRTRVH